MHSASSGCSLRMRSASTLFITLCRLLKTFTSNPPIAFCAPSRLVSQTCSLVYATCLLATQSPRLAGWRDFSGSTRATNAVVPVLARRILTYEFPVWGSVMMFWISSSVSLEICLGPSGSRLTRSALIRSSMLDVHGTNISSMVN